MGELILYDQKIVLFTQTYFIYAALMDKNEVVLRIMGSHDAPMFLKSQEYTSI